MQNSFAPQVDPQQSQQRSASTEHTLGIRADYSDLDYVFVDPKQPKRHRGEPPLQKTKKLSANRVNRSGTSVSRLPTAQDQMRLGDKKFAAMLRLHSIEFELRAITRKAEWRASELEEAIGSDTVYLLRSNARGSTNAVYSKIT